MAIRERTGRGRQAEAKRNDDAVLDAARVVFATQGPDAPMSAVAAQACVGMGSLYRRFATKAEMLDFLCEASLRQQVDIADAALALADPLAALAWYVTGCVEHRVGVFTLLADEVSPTAEARALAQQAHGLLERIVTRAHEAGVLREDVGGVDIYRLVELFSRRSSGSFGDAEAHQRLVVLALDGMRAPGVTALPGDPPTWADYARQWQAQSSLAERIAPLGYSGVKCSVIDAGLDAGRAPDGEGRCVRWLWRAGCAACHGSAGPGGRARPGADPGAGSRRAAIRLRDQARRLRGLQPAAVPGAAG